MEKMVGQVNRRKSIQQGLRVERAREGISQTKLAKKLKVNPATVSSWEKGTSAIRLEDAWRIADFYGISLDQLANRSSQSPGRGSDHHADD